MGKCESLSNANGGRIFKDSVAYLDGMKPNISAHTVIFKLGFTEDWDISREIEHQQLCEMF